MNALGLVLAWTALQVTVFCLVGIGLYLLARRRNPAAGALAAWSVLLIATGMSALGVSPWPRWWTLAQLSEARGAVEVNRLQSAIDGKDLSASVATRSDRDAEKARSAAADNQPTSRRAADSFWRALFVQLQTEVDQSTDDLTDPLWRWPAWLGIVMLAGSGTGLIRLGLSLAAVSRFRRGTRRLTDPELWDMLARIRSQLNCRRPVELRELHLGQAIGSPATIGWRRPMIILPEDWRDWSTAQRQAILAHEVAHIARGDFAIWLAAQIAVVLHFYNPLVHWLSSRLRLEQEMAADLRGAAVAGGPQLYMTVLAQMALRQDQPRPLWAGRPFLPSRGTLMRRIEMLHNQRLFAELSPSRIQGAVLLVALALCGLGVSGLRGPENRAQAEPPAEAKAAESPSPNLNEVRLPKFDMSYLPAEAVAVTSVKPLDVADSRIMPVFVRFPGLLAFTMTAQGNDRVVEIEEVKTVVIGPTRDLTGAAEAPGVVIYRTSKPYDWSKLRVRLFGDSDGMTEVTVHGQKCFRAKSEVSGKVILYFLPDDRIIACVYEHDVERVVAADSQHHPAWYGEWQEAAQSPIAVASSVAALADEVTDQADKTLQMLASIGKKAELVLGTVDPVAGGLEIHARAICQSPDDARQISTLTQLLLTLAAQQVPSFVKSLSLPEEFQSLDLAGALTNLISGMVISVEATDIRVKATIGADFVAKFSQAAATFTTRYTEEQKQTHVTKLGRLVEAMQAYHVAHGHYPPSSVIGPDGKTTHSWRVELLPYLDEQKLYQRYKLDEPWDGEHNKQLVNEVPAAFHSGDWTQSGCSDYYLVTGKGTLFDGDASPKRDSITDNAGETILVVENRRQIPWTKPLDIDNAAQGNRWQLNGSTGKGFYAGFADGTVKFLPADTDPATLRALFTKAGGEKVKLR
jgi:beta-lactamase regulating signal transducer with metallopeptidase domain